MATQTPSGIVIAVNSTGNIGKGLVEEALRQARYLGATVVAPETDDSLITFLLKGDTAVLGSDERSWARMASAQPLITRGRPGWIMGIECECSTGADDAVTALASIQIKDNARTDDPIHFRRSVPLTKRQSAVSATVMDALREPVTRLLQEFFETAMGTEAFAASRDLVVDLCGPNDANFHEIAIGDKRTERMLVVKAPIRHEGDRARVDVSLGDRWHERHLLGERLARHLPKHINCLVGVTGQEALLQVLGEIVDFPVLLLEMRPIPSKGLTHAFLKNRMALVNGSCIVIPTDKQMRLIAGRSVAVVSETLSAKRAPLILCEGLVALAHASKAAPAGLFIQGGPDWHLERGAIYLAEVPDFLA